MRRQSKAGLDQPKPAVNTFLMAYCPFMPSVSINNWSTGKLQWGERGAPQWLSKNPMQVMQVQSLGWEDPLEQGKATLSSILAWEISWTEEPGKLQPMRSQRAWHDLATKQQEDKLGGKRHSRINYKQIKPERKKKIIKLMASPVKCLTLLSWLPHVSYAILRIHPSCEFLAQEKSQHLFPEWQIWSSCWRGSW